MKDEIGGALADHDRGCSSVPADDLGYNRSVGDPHVHGRVQFARGGDHGRRSVDGDDPMPKLLQVSGKTAFAAADVDRPPARRREQLKELVAVTSPVALMSGSPRPVDPLARFGFPAV